MGKLSFRDYRRVDFAPYENDKTYVTITNSGFKGDGDKVVSDALDS